MLSSQQTPEIDQIRESIERGLADSAAGRVSDLGSFAQFLDDGEPVVLDLEDPYFHGQTLPNALSDYDHVHSTTGVCVKNSRGLCS